MMRRMTRNVLFGLLILVFIFVFLFYMTNNPKKIIEKKMGFILSESSQVGDYSYNRFNGEFEAKISIAPTDIDKLRNDLLGYFNYEYTNEFERISINFEPKWWDMDYDRILYAYGGAEIGSGLVIVQLTAVNSAFIVKQKDGEHYLYLDFVILPKDVIF